MRTRRRHCQPAKMENVKLRRKGGAAAHDVANFGGLATADTMVLTRGLKDWGFSRRGGRDKRRARREARAIVLPTHSRSQVRDQEKGPARAIAPAFPKQSPRPRLMRDQLRWRSIHLMHNRRSAKAKTVPFPKAGEVQTPKAEPKERRHPFPKGAIRLQGLSPRR